jgi:hypothetical protein
MADNTVTQQIVREDPAIEAYKLKLLQESQNLAFNVDRTPLSQQLPDYQVAGFTSPQTAAMQAAEGLGVGAFTPYMNAANQALGGAYATTGEAADYLRGADTRQQFTDAQLAMQQAGGAVAGMTQGLQPIGQGLGYLDAAGQRALMSDTTGRFQPAYQDLATGLGALATGQNMAAMSSQADLRPATAAIGQGLSGLTEAQRMATQGLGADFSGSQALMGQAAGESFRALQQPGFGMAESSLLGGIGTLGGATGRFSPGDTAAFMDPYRQQVIDETMRQIDRQAAMAQQGLSAQAVRSGAFGGEREGVQRAEMERNVLDQKSSTIANLLSQGYSQAQANALASFEQQQQRQMQAGQGIGQIGSQFGQLAAQQAGLGQAAAGQLANVGQTVGQQAAQQAGLTQSGAGLYGNLSQQQIAAGQGLGQLGVQQAGLGQSAANLYNQAAQQYGNFASQQGALAGQEAAINQNIANLLMQQGGQYGQMGGQIANIYGQQGAQFQGLGQGIGGLAGQQFGIGQQTASGLGALAGQLGQLGVQQGALGQTAQALQQGDINFLYNVGQAQQAFNQQGIDAQRASQLQQIYAPYQQAGFLSDIYKGAPSSQMATMVSSQPTASPFQQAIGIGLGALSTAAGAQKAKLF